MSVPNIFRQTQETDTQKTGNPTTLILNITYVWDPNMKSSEQIQYIPIQFHQAFDWGAFFVS
jgi:hypothetical protein